MAGRYGRQRNDEDADEQHDHGYHADETALAALSQVDDGVRNREAYGKHRANLSEGFTETVPDGGCHAYFGAYGMQKGDGTPTLSRDEQIRQTAAQIANFAFSF